MSIRFKLSLWLSGLIIIATLIGLFLFESMLRDAFHDSIINRLEEDLEHIIIATRLDDGELVIDQSQLSSFYRPAYSGRYFQLNLPDRTIRSRSLWDAELQIEPLQAQQKRVWQAKGPKNNDMQLLSIGIGAPNSPNTATLTVAQDLSIGRRVFSEVFGAKLAINIGMLLAMIAGIFIILRQSFKPVNQIQGALAKLREGEIASLTMSQIPAEIRPLAETYNELLDYTAKQIERSRNNLGNLSHGLKTPLAVMQQQVEALGLTHPDAAIAMQQQLDLVHKMIEQTLHKVHHQRVIECRVVNAQHISRIPIHREDGMELFGNLLDNAFKWANSQVNISIVDLPSGEILIQIEDDGCGVMQEQIALLTARGTRLDEATTGHGLGLSIVKEICEQYGFILKFNRSETLQGLNVSILINP